MKNLYLIVLFILSSVVVLGQAPAQINYQGVARNAVGNVLPHQNIKLRISIRDGNPTGSIVFQETHLLKTNLFGMFNVAIGGPGGADRIGTLENVNWANGNAKFIQVEMDPAGGSKYMNMGTSPLLSVPYALFAAKSLPGGPAGGSLTGTYPNPSLAPDAVKGVNIEDGVITTEKIANGAVTAAKLAPGVIPASIPPGGAAGGDLIGTYPNPWIGNNTINTNKLQDGSVTAAKLAPGLLSSLSFTGPAGGDLNGNYPNPSIALNAITNEKILDGAITASKLAAGVIPSSLPPSGTAGGDLTGNYPNPSLALNAVTNEKILDGTITAAKLAAGVIPTSLPPSGTAGGDLTGTYPNPTIADNAISTSKLQDGSVTIAKLAPGIVGGSTPTGPAGGDLGGTYPNPSVTRIQGISISTVAPAVGDVLKFDGTNWTPGAGTGGGSTPTGPAGGDLNGAYPNPNIAPQAVTNNKIATDAVTTQKIKDGSVTTAKLTDNAVTNIKLADDAVTTTKILDGSVTAAKLAPGVIGGSNPIGPAGGDLTGTYPNPTIAANAITTGKIADGSITDVKMAANSVATNNIIDGSVTAVKLAPGVIPASLPPSGAAGGDLSGTYPNPLVAKLQGQAISNTIPSTGQVLKFDGTQWAPGADNAGSGGGLTLPYSSTATNTSSLFSITNSGAGSAINGTNSTTNANAYGVLGTISAASPGSSSAAVKGQNSGTGTDGYGVWGTHAGGGAGVFGTSVTGSGVKGNSTSGYGVQAYSVSGKGLFATSDAENAAFFDVSTSTNPSDAVFISNLGLGNGTAIMTDKNNAMLAITNDIGGAGVLGVNMSGGEAIVGRSFGNNGTGLVAQANAGGTNGNALVAELFAAGGNMAVFRMSGTNVARIDDTGKGFFNGGTQVGGADIAEFFAVTGNRSQYEPGDVLVISESSDRTVTKSSSPYSTLVAGVYATKPGVYLTEENAERNQLDAMVPMGVIGVIPTKVCLEGGAIKRGDLLVTSSISGVAMKADPDKIKVGQALGKALQDYNAAGIGKINVLVSVK